MLPLPPVETKLSCWGTLSSSSFFKKKNKNDLNTFIQRMDYLSTGRFVSVFYKDETGCMEHVCLILENPASNLLAWEVSKMKWLCQKGEPSCSVVLQLTKAVQINSVQIGAFHGALVEVLVGRSEKPNEPFQVLVPSSVFLTPIESRKGEAVEKVRSFTSDQLSSEVRDERWDRVRVVCSQPYNKHCKYGLSFIHLNEPEAKSKAIETKSEAVESKPKAVPNRLFNLDAMSSDEEEFKPGELFAKHKLDLSGEGTSTDAQIRQASSQAIKNISDSATKLMKTPINKQNKHGAPQEIKEKQDRQRNSLMYTDDDDQPHRKIDHIVNRHKDEKAKAESDRNTKEKQKKDSNKTNDSYNSKDDKVKHDKDDISKEERKQKKDSQKRDTSSTRKEVKTPQSDRDRNITPSHSRTKTDKLNKTKPGGGLRPGPISDDPHNLLSHVTFVLSGYENPRRADIRDKALAMGARFERDWTSRCTHLICAFPNTPKLKSIRSSPGNTAIAVTGEWIEECCQAVRLLPWQWFATEHKFRVPKGDIDSEEESERRNKRPSQHSDSEETPSKKKKKIEGDSHDRDVRGKEKEDKSNTTQKQSQDSDQDSSVVFLRDERMQGNVSLSDSDSQATDEEESQVICSVDGSKTLPDFFEGYTFVIDDDVTIDRCTLGRYVKAYGGVLYEQSQLDEDSKVDYWLCAGANNGVIGTPVRADWVWKCHENKKRWPVKEYLIC